VDIREETNRLKRGALSLLTFHTDAKMKHYISTKLTEEVKI
jgi:hypothetical protein